jgi:hypothetical protein
MAQEKSEESELDEEFLALLIPAPRRSPENVGVR